MDCSLKAEGALRPNHQTELNTGSTSLITSWNHRDKKQQLVAESQCTSYCCNAVASFILVPGFRGVGVIVEQICNTAKCFLKHLRFITSLTLNSSLAIAHSGSLYCYPIFVTLTFGY